VNCGKQTTTEETKKITETPMQGGYDVKVKVVDTAKKPVVGATVTLHSNPQTTKTDKNGVAFFNNVEAGDHKVLIAYNNFEGEQVINLTGEVKQFNLDIQVKPQNVFLNQNVLLALGIMGIAVIVLTTLLIKSRKRKLA
jgi:hypothetical protein